MAIAKFSVLTLGDKIYISLSAMVSAVAGWGFTGEVGYALLAAAIGAIVTGLPRIIVALTGARKSISDIMHQERATLQQALMDERDTVRLVRISKHNFQNELQRFWFHSDYLEETLRHHGIEYDPMERTPLETLTRFEDMGIASIIDRQLEMSD